MNEAVKCLVKLTTSKYSALVLYLFGYGTYLPVSPPVPRKKSIPAPEVGDSISSRNVVKFTTVNNFIITAMRDNFIFQTLLVLNCQLTVDSASYIKQPSP